MSAAQERAASAEKGLLRKNGLGIPSKKNPPWWPTAAQKIHADAGCAHPDVCHVAPSEAEYREHAARIGADYGRELAEQVGVIPSAEDGAS